MAYQVVTNFDTHPYIPGSFYADAAATAPPVAGHAFAGIIYQANDNGDMVVEARDLTTGVNYIRIHSGGVWGTWDVDNTSQFVKKSGDTMTGPLILNADPSSGLGAATKQYADARGAFTPSGNIAATTVQGAIAELDTEKVAKLGDTMTGDLTINKAIPTINLKKTAAGQNNTIAGYNNATARWVILLGDSAAEGGADAGSDFAVQAFDDSGAYKHQVLNINRAAGLIQVKGDPTAALGVATKQYVDGKVVAATAAEYVANSAPTKMLTPGAVWGAAALLAVTPSGSTFTIDMNAGLDFNLTLTAAGMTMANPTNSKVGQKGIIYLSQDATGGRTITTWGSAWKFPGGIKPTLSTGASTIDAISYVVTAAGAFICCTFSAGFA
jgi:hypothetical protein